MFGVNYAGTTCSVQNVESVSQNRPANLFWAMIMKTSNIGYSTRAIGFVGSLSKEKTE